MKPGTPLFEGLDFKQAIARTPAIVGKLEHIPLHSLAHDML